MDEDDTFLELFCHSCQDETDQRADAAEATCLRCGAVNPVQVEEDRVAALLRRVEEEHSAELGVLHDYVRS
jgi:adenine-specific DNA methylase